MNAIHQDDDMIACISERKKYSRLPLEENQIANAYHLLKGDELCLTISLNVF
jgi:hypothetical protein